MGLTFHACDRIIERQHFERPNPRITPTIVDDERRYETRLKGDFATGKTVSAAEPLVRPLASTGPLATERVLHAVCSDRRYRRSIGRLPECMAQFVVVPKPQRPTHLRSYHGVFECE